MKSLSTWAKYHHEDAIEMYRQALESGDKELMEAAAVTLKFISSRHPEGYQQFLAMANSVTDEDFAAKRDEQVGILEKKEVRTYNADKLMEHRAAIFYVVSHEEVFRNNREAIGEVLARLYSAGPVRFGKDRRSGSITIRRDRENKQIKRFRRILRLLLDPQHQKMLKPVLRATLEQLVDIDHGKATRLAQDMYEMSSYDDKMICSVLEALAFTDPTEYIRTIEMVWNQGNEDELRGASRSLKALLYSINRPDIEPVKDKEREFLERYLDSGYVLTKKGTPRKESGIIRELSGLVRKEVDYERLSEALEKGLAKNLGQLYRLSHTNIPGLIVFEEIEERGVSSRVYKALDKTVDERGEDI
ncbi:TPA: hypothetical protein HA265_05845, partial [Candidatus Woesearchaeota archaeon]|nr:hypothetical protein [Candidatus Woesearchaeota archaeon]